MQNHPDRHPFTYRTTLKTYLTIIMKKLVSLHILLLPIISHAETCIIEFNEQILFSEILKGNQIHTPFLQSYLIDGKFEPELKTKYIDKQSLAEISRLLNNHYSTPSSVDTEKIIKQKDGAILVTFRGPDSGYNIEYIFKRINECWKFTEFTDWST